MGGKTWSKQEERFFWKTIVPQSPKAVKPSDRVHDWKACAEIMQREMGTNARRKYSKLMLFEHYFQNVQTGHRSPCAREFVVEHKRELGEFRKGQMLDPMAGDSPASSTTDGYWDAEKAC
ncbi:uncharacterized protein TRIREDRAFT_106219 [Trichoderma reesei QM6a]|uniref:Predicted protein n=3 Tax=Trichoderma TaxID=5543 RepID=G0RHC6_HYPJQ|nr:uncharacterized protein TRIREDRAFT_106219 [Trichoderma reesei QM6a]EGR49485.1 predicted protein [Trichoderma reesei QM6a]OTA07561.1 hypothetical protein A9Z42_0084580 [Trichoderma parareesei]